MEQQGGTAEGRFTEDLRRSSRDASDVIPLLQAAQDSWGYVPERALIDIAATTGLSLTEVYGVVTFYKQFRLTPVGRHIVRVCNGTACHVNGSPSLEAVVNDTLGILRGETDPDGLFTLESVNCIGCCGLSPVVTIGDDVHGSLTPRKLTSILERTRRKAREAT